jgi:hypothetical protein
VTEAIINLQAPLVKSYLLNALLINRKAFPIEYHGAQVLRPASRYSARLNAVRRDCLLWQVRDSEPCQRRRQLSPKTAGPHSQITGAIAWSKREESRGCHIGS